MKIINHTRTFFLVSLILIAFLFGNNQLFYGQDLKQDYSSKVPKYKFSSNLEEQEAELNTNPLMLRFNKSRNDLSSDPYRPIYHYVNPEGNLNDPNGLCYWMGKWHLFYQAYPPEDTRQHWGHAVSKDLIHWKDLPYAIYPDPEYQCFSGTTFVEENRVIAMYHGTRAGNMVAISSDPLLLNWEKITNGPVIPIKSKTGFPLAYRVFDPCIWKKDSVYYSLSGGTLPGPGGMPVRANFLFRSLDLTKWEYMHEFTEGERHTLLGDDGACPYFWPIGDRYILPFFSHMSGGQYLLGDYDKLRDKFIVTSSGKFNFGAATPAGVHAPSAAPDGKGGVVVIFNMNPGKPTKGWNQIMTLPRLLTLKSREEIGIQPAGNIESLRYQHQHIGQMELPANKEIVLNKIKGNAIEIVAEIDLKEAPMVEINVLRSNNKEEFTRIAFYKERGFRGTPPNPRYSLVSLETSYSSVLPDVMSRAPETAPVTINPEEKLSLRIFVDKSVVEVFVNNRQCVAARVYPGLKNSIGVSIRAQGKSAQLLSLDAYQMKSIY